MSLHLFLVNETTVLADSSCEEIAEAVNIQLQRDFHSWRSDAFCVFLPGGGQAKVPPGGAILHLLDTCDVAGALGYHDETGKLVPYGRIGVKTAIQNGQEPSEVTSHEGLELAGDPHVNDTAPNGNLTKLFAKEACDAVQGNGYEITISSGKQIKVANFVLPIYFDPRTPANQRTDFRGAISGPFALAPQGYYSYVDLTNLKAGWQQRVGSERVGPPPVDVDDRVARRSAVAVS